MIKSFKMFYDTTDNSRPVNIGGTTYTYDDNGNILTAANEEGTTKRAYDALNRVISFTDVNGRKISYTYDEVSNLTSITYPDGEVVTYKYNLGNELVEVNDYKGRITSYNYDVNGRLINTILPNGSSEAYHYDNKGQVTKKVLTIDGIEFVSTYDYDESGKITSEDLLDISDTNENTLINFFVPNVDMDYTKGNRLSEYNGKKIIYDEDGNMTYGPLNDVMADYSYDKFNRLTSVSNTKYYYDAEGIRVKQVHNNKTTTYVTDPMGYLSKLLLQSNPDGTEIIYVYGNGLISQETKTINESGKTSYKDYRVYHYDYRGSTIALTNELGNITDTFSYGAYEELIEQIGNTKTIFTYVGKYGVQTDENPLIYMRNRYIWIVQRSS